MKVQRQLTALRRGTAACIGAFDGLHLGHQALLQRAAAPGSAVAIVTFDPHPAQVLAPARAPTLLQTPRQRERVANLLGVDTLVLVPFTRALAAMTPAQFAQEILIEGLRPARVVVGADFRFGADRRGDASTLAALLEPAGIVAEIVALREGVTAVDAARRSENTKDNTKDKTKKIGSSVIRALIREGDLEAIPPLLGRLYAIEGTVVHGAGRGRGLGVPTANIACAGALLPPPGVYAAALQVVDPRSPLYGARWPAAANLGTNPTFTAGTPDAPLILEVHALDVDLSDRLYGLTVEVGLVARLRDERAFVDAAALTAAIADDLQRCRQRVDAAAMSRLWPPPRAAATPTPALAHEAGGER